MGVCLIADSSLLSFFAGLMGTAWVIFKVAAGLGAVIFVHELGHFLVAKACGVKCEKFLVGFDVPIKIFGFSFPKTLWKRQWGETEYAVGIIPLGGYVKMLGQDDNPANYEAEMERSRLRNPEDADSQNDAAAESVTEGATDATAPSVARDTTPAQTKSTSDTALPEAAASVETTGEAPSDSNAAPEMTRAGSPTSDAPPADKADTADNEEEIELDPRSFLAKSVPQRMAIISAGVIFNLIFAVIFASIAYWLGVKYTPCVIGSTIPGSPAREMNVPPGDQAVQIGKNGSENQHLRYGMDLLQNVAMTGVNEDIDLLLQSPGENGKKTWYAIRPRKRKVGSDSLPMIGVTSASTTTLGGSEEIPPGIPHLPGGQAKEPFKPVDKIVAIEVNGTSLAVPDYATLRKIMVQHAEDELTYVLERKIPAKDGEDPESVETTTVRVTVAPNPLRHAGLVMKMGPVSSIQKDSPAEKAGMKMGDLIRSIDGKPVSDPVALPHILHRMAGQEITVGVLREAKTVELKITPRLPTMHDVYGFPDTPLAVQPLGIAFPILNSVKAVEPGGPAEKAGIKPGDELITASFVAAGDEQKTTEKETLGLGDDEIELGENRNWMQVVERLQMSLPDTKLQLELKRGEEEQTLLLETVASEEFFRDSRGFRLRPLSRVQTADSVGEAVALGYRNTWESLSHVFKFLRKLVTGQISPKHLGGPGTIMVVAGSEAKQGISRLLLFLTLLSANLAIINFLPIPVLDGGHMLFLLYEGIRGKPVNEAIAMRLTVAGLIFILGLMVFVLSLDIYRIAQWLGA